MRRLSPPKCVSALIKAQDMARRSCILRSTLKSKPGEPLAARSRPPSPFSASTSSVSDGRATVVTVQLAEDCGQRASARGVQRPDSLATPHRPPASTHRLPNAFPSPAPSAKGANENDRSRTPLESRAPHDTPPRQSGNGLFPKSTLTANATATPTVAAAAAPSHPAACGGPFPAVLGGPERAHQPPSAAGTWTIHRYRASPVHDHSTENINTRWPAAMPSTKRPLTCSALPAMGTEGGSLGTSGFLVEMQLNATNDRGGPTDDRSRAHCTSKDLTLMPTCRSCPGSSGSSRLSSARPSSPRRNLGARKTSFGSVLSATTVQSFPHFSGAPPVKGLRRGLPSRTSSSDASEVAPTGLPRPSSLLITSLVGSCHQRQSSNARAGTACSTGLSRSIGFARRRRGEGESSQTDEEEEGCIMQLAQFVRRMHTTNTVQERERPTEGDGNVNRSHDGGGGGNSLDASLLLSGATEGEAEVVRSVCRSSLGSGAADGPRRGRHRFPPSRRSAMTGSRRPARVPSSNADDAAVVEHGERSRCSQDGSTTPVLPATTSSLESRATSGGRSRDVEACVEATLANMVRSAPTPVDSSRRRGRPSVVNFVLS